jgi:tetratricopeptide (TPR) repeat protein
MDPATQLTEFFHAGGALPVNAVYYVQRPADEQLYRVTLSGEYCSVLTPRQMGKSSLMVRTAARLQAAGVRTAIIDLTTIGVELSTDQWYFGLISSLKRTLDLAVDERAWWNSQAHHGVVQRFSNFLRDVVLTEVAPPRPVVIFIDEIDSTLSLPFTDDFFVAIRAAYNARASDPAYKRLTFVLLGVARPSDLIKDRARTPYNIGLSIDLKDFTSLEASRLLPGLAAVSAGQAEPILERVLYWTGGHPYLTQKVCVEIVATQDGRWTAQRIDMLVKRLFVSDEARKESNLQYIADRIRENRERERLLRVYRQVISGKPVVDDERDPVKSQLKLSGLLKVTPEGTLVVRNPIYEAVFNQQWIKATMPKLTATRITVVAVIVALVALVIGGILFYRQQNGAQIQAQAYTESFLNTQSAAVRITNLAGLFRLGGQFAAQARNLFFNLDSEEQLALYTSLAAPEQVGEDLQIVIKGVYTQLDNSDHYSALLQAMTDSLDKIAASFPDSRLLNGEIKAWLDGRQQAQAGNDKAAIEAYAHAISYNDQNPAVYLDRAEAYTRLGQHNEALMDFNRTMELDPGRQAQIANAIRSDSALRDYLMNHQQAFPTLADLGKK